MIVSGSNNLSDDSDDDVENSEVDTYRRKYQLLLERCEVLQQVKFCVFLVFSDSVCNWTHTYWVMLEQATISNSNEIWIPCT
jgi:hypothetical protein